MTTSGFPQEANVVIIGGGIIGSSTAYHLGKMGCQGVVLLERHQIASGTTWHSAAQVRQLRSSKNLTQMVQHSTRVYASLEAETGLPTGWRQCGSISIATNEERLTHIRRQASLARAFDIEIHEIDAAEVKRLWPAAYTDDIIGAIYSPTDGRVEPKETALALIAGAKQHGVQVFENTKVTGITQRNGRVASVMTSKGEIACRAVVNCAGAWGREVASMVGVTAPLYACEHLYIVSEPIEKELLPTPILSDHDGRLYTRQHEGGILVGCFESKAKPLDIRTLPAEFAFGVLEWDHEHFKPILANAIHRIPILKDTPIKTFLNGPESFTPDDNLLLGESPDLRGFFLGCGLNSVGVATGGGVGRTLAEWVIHGSLPMDIWSVDVRRFGRFHNNLKALRERIPETMSLHYAIAYPNREKKTTRNLRLTPIHHRLAANGAQFGTRMGWERANWFMPPGATISTDLTFGKPGWFDQVGVEHQAAREKVALFDQSTFAKLVVQGRDAESFLQRLCANNMAIEPGQIVYSGMLNRIGGYESDFTVQRLSGDCFMIITSTANAVHDLVWIKDHIEPNEFVTVFDVTGAYAVLSVMGPNSRRLLQQVSPNDFSNDAFPNYTHQEIEIGHTIARAARLSYVGELGWELYVPSESAVPIYDALHEAGKAFGLINSGAFALTSLRIEKGYRAWGHDISPEDTPLQAGLDFAVDFNKKTPFIGRDALLKQRDEGITRRLISLTLDAQDVYPMGNEPIYYQGQVIGKTTSGTYGHTLKRPVMLGYIKIQEAGLKTMLRQGTFEVEYACVRYPAKASLRAFYDPKGKRLRG